MCCLVLLLLIMEHRSQGCLPLPLPATTIHPEGQADAGWAESSFKIFNLLSGSQTVVCIKVTYRAC